MAVFHLPHVRGKFNQCYLDSASSLRCKASSKMNLRSRIGKPESIYTASSDYGCEIEMPMSVNLCKRVYRRGYVQKVSSSECNDVADFPDSNEIVELPLFPLPLVLLPGATIPLQIFEFRYRIMMHTLLQGNLRFGIIYSDSTHGAADVGCVGEIIKHERLVDDRFFVICKGQERFHVVNVVRTKPYLVAEVQWIEDRPSMIGQQDLEDLATEVETCLKDVIRLSNKLNRKQEKEAFTDLRGNLFPAPFSFFVASTFEGAPREQQELLELKDTVIRLTRERETLKNTLNYLAAASAVKDAFQFSSFNDN